MAKERTIQGKVQSIQTKLLNTAFDKYFNLWMSKYESELDPRLLHYIMKAFYERGTLAAFRPKNTDDFIVHGYTTKQWNIYDFPEVIKFVKDPRRPIDIIPDREFIVNKEDDPYNTAVVGFIQSNHEPISVIVSNYVHRIVEVEMVMNTNLQTLKLPLLIGTSPQTKKKAEAIVNKIMNNEPVLFEEFDNIDDVKVFVNGNQYMLDKLLQHKQALECELLTFLGLDNAVSANVNLDITNANNNVINAFREDIDKNLQNFVKDCEYYLGLKFEIKPKQAPVKSLYEGDKNRTLENNTDKDGKQATKEGDEE